MADSDAPSSATLFRSPEGALTETAAPTSSHPPRVNPVLADAARSGPRYEARSLLGRGGMGEVRLVKDVRVGREVALKLLLPRVAGTLDGRARFLREARVQGQLEHPTIVPVHDLDVMEDGSVYFTMKRVRGVTLAEVQQRLRAGDEETQKRFTTRRLLSVLQAVCLGIDFAHSRGVVHRDIKPSNVMLGDFGEVYVLDWGLAKVLDVDDVGFAGVDDEITGAGGVRSLVGVVMGTPGYMAPEQLDPSFGPVDARTDVYALGALLFEVLAGRPLVDSRDRAEIARATLEGGSRRVLAAADEGRVPSTLVEVLLRALSPRPEERLSSARSLHDALEQYLEGAQDLERRKALSRETAARADALLEDGRADGGPSEEQRGAALQALGRALALDPDNDAARSALLRILTEPPRQTPPEVKERLARAFDDTVRMGARLNVPTLFAWAPFLPFALYSGIRDWAMLAGVFVPLAVATVASFVCARQARPGMGWQLLAITATLVGYVACSRVLGPFLFLPALIGTYTVVVHTHPLRAMRWFGAVAGVLAIVAPFALEALGVLPRSYTFTDDAMLVHPQMLTLKEVPITLLVLLASIAITLLPAFYVGRMRDALTAAEERLQTAAWQLERLVPKQPALDEDDAR